VYTFHTLETPEVLLGILEGSTKKSTVRTLVATRRLERMNQNHHENAGNRWYILLGYKSREESIE
jgi:hypothetical protein